MPYAHVKRHFTLTAELHKLCIIICAPFNYMYKRRDPSAVTANYTKCPCARNRLGTIYTLTKLAVWSPPVSHTGSSCTLRTRSTTPLLPVSKPRLNHSITLDCDKPKRVNNHGK